MSRTASSASRISSNAALWNAWVITDGLRPIASARVLREPRSCCLMSSSVMECMNTRGDSPAWRRWADSLMRRTSSTRHPLMYFTWVTVQLAWMCPMRARRAFRVFPSVSSRSDARPETNAQRPSARARSSTARARWKHGPSSIAGLVLLSRSGSVGIVERLPCPRPNRILRPVAVRASPEVSISASLRRVIACSAIPPSSVTSTKKRQFRLLRQTLDGPAWNGARCCSRPRARAGPLLSTTLTPLGHEPQPLLVLREVLGQGLDRHLASAAASASNGLRATTP